jgi:hypothetical protein
VGRVSGQPDPALSVRPDPDRSPGLLVPPVESQLPATTILVAVREMLARPETLWEDDPTQMNVRSFDVTCAAPATPTVPSPSDVRDVAVINNPATSPPTNDIKCLVASRA